MQSLNDENSPVWFTNFSFLLLLIVNLLLLYLTPIVVSFLTRLKSLLFQHQSETVDIGTYDQSVPKSYSMNGNFLSSDIIPCD